MMSPALNVLLLLTALLFQHGSTQSNVTDTTIQMPPAITVSSEKLIYYRIDGTDGQLLECGAVGAPVPTFQWYKNSQLLDVNNLPNIKPQGQGSILISPLAAGDAGLYQCIVINTWGTAVTNITSFQLASLPSFTGNAAPTQTQKNQGVSAILNCQPPSSVPTASYTWVISNGQNDQFPTQLSVEDPRFQVNQATGNLHFANVIPNDSASGTYMYRCGAYNPYLQNSNGGGFNQLQVTGVTNPASVAPTAAFQTLSPTVAVVGRSFRLTCFFNGYPTPTVTWTKSGGGTLPADRSTVTNANTVLTINPVDLSDAAVYVCAATNSAGTQQLSITLYVEAEPTFVSAPVNINATDGQNASFRCDVTGSPAPTISWFRNTRALTPSSLPSKFSLSPDLKVLTITNVCKQCPGGETDLQVIQCNASNSQGYAYGAGYLNVLLQTKIVDYPASQKLVATAETVLSCGSSYDASTPVSVIWYFNGEPFNNVQGQVFTDANGNLHFYTPNLANGGAAYAGNYTCFVSNGYSQDHASAIITRADIIYQSSVADFWWVFLIIALILILIIAAVLIVCHMRRNRGDSYPVDDKERENGNDPEKELENGAFQDYQRSEVKAPLIPPTGGFMSDSTLRSDAGSSNFDDNGSYVNPSAGYSQQKSFQY